MLAECDNVALTWQDVAFLGVIFSPLIILFLGFAIWAIKD